MRVKPAAEQTAPSAVAHPQVLNNCPANKLHHSASIVTGGPSKGAKDLVKIMALDLFSRDSSLGLRIDLAPSFPHDPDVITDVFKDFSRVMLEDT